MAVENSQGAAHIMKAIDVRVTDDAIHVVLADGRRIAAPLAWSPRLADATPAQRKNWRLIGRGQGIRWPDVDEDVFCSELAEDRLITALRSALIRQLTILQSFQKAARRIEPLATSA